MTKADRLDADLEELGMSSPVRRRKFAWAVIKHDPCVFGINNLSFRENDEVEISYRISSGKSKSMIYIEASDTVVQ